jgi:hypothetical protein
MGVAEGAVVGNIRFSLGKDNNNDDVDYVVNTLRNLIQHKNSWCINLVKWIVPKLFIFGWHIGGEKAGTPLARTCSSMLAGFSVHG